MSNDEILLVDDNDGQRVTLESILRRSGFKVTSANCGNAALSAAEARRFAAVLLDIKMPDLTGIDVLKQIKNQNPDTTVIMMTGYSDTDYAIDALNAGASAYLLKPANIEQIKTLLTHAIEYQRLIEENKAMSAALREWNGELERKVKDRTAQLMQANKMTLDFYKEIKKNFESTIEVLSIAIDQRDPLTATHSFRVTQYAIEIARVMKLGDDELERLRYAGLMHDLGKIEIKQTILCKEGSLTTEEYKEIQTHAQGTFSLLSKFKFKGELADVPLIASSHHERYDGSGYPRRLKADDIPFLARILAVADVLDAITSKRHYRTAMSIKDALSIIKRESNGHFDPRCADALFKMPVSEFLKIHMADHLERFDTRDLVELAPVRLSEILAATQSQTPSETDLRILRLFYKYYQGPVPPHLESTIEPAPRFGEAA